MLEGRQAATIRDEGQNHDLIAKTKKSQLHRFSDPEKECCRQGDRNIPRTLPQTWRVIYESKNEQPVSQKRIKINKPMP